MLLQMVMPLFLAYRIAGRFPHSFGEEWRWMPGESAKRRNPAGDAGFRLSFCTLTGHPSHILWVELVDSFCPPAC